MLVGPRNLCWLLAAGTILTRIAALATPQVTLAWDPSPSPSIGGYRLYYGVSSRDYTNLVDVGELTTATVSNLVVSATYFFAVTAYDIAGLESDYSSEISYTVPTPAARLQIAAQDQSLTLTASGPAGSNYSVLTSTDLVNWQQLTNLNLDVNGISQFIVPADPAEAQRFFRLQQTSPLSLRSP